MQRPEFRFERLIIDRSRAKFENLKFFPQVLELYAKFLENIEDDFSLLRQELFVGLFDFVEKTTPHFYLVLYNDEVCGFFALERFIGNYSAEVMTCFNPMYWGYFTKCAGLAFRQFCFEELKLKKIKALVYSQNTKVKGLLKSCGFDLEAVLKKETLKNGVAQDIEVYSVFSEESEGKCNLKQKI